MPAGIQSPLVVEYNASSVPVLQISLSSDTLNEQQLYDYGLYNLRQRCLRGPGRTECKMPILYSVAFRHLLMPPSWRRRGSSVQHRRRSLLLIEPDVFEPPAV